MGSFSVRKRKQFVCFSVLKALTAAAVLTAVSCGGAVAVENIKVTPTTLSLGIGETAVLKAEVEPADRWRPARQPSRRKRSTAGKRLRVR